MGIGEIILVVGLLGFMLAPSVYIGIKTKRWHLCYVFLTFFACFGFWEWHAVTFTGMSVSQQVWAFGEEHPTSLRIVIAMLIISWLTLMYHFAEKLFLRQKNQQ